MLQLEGQLQALLHGRVLGAVPVAIFCKQAHLMQAAVQC